MTDAKVTSSESAAAETTNTTGTTPEEEEVGASAHTGAVIRSDDLVRRLRATSNSSATVHVTADGDTLESIALLYGLGNAQQDVYQRNMSEIERTARESGYSSSENGTLLAPGTLLEIGPTTAHPTDDGA